MIITVIYKHIYFLVTYLYCSLTGSINELAAGVTTMST